MYKQGYADITKADMSTSFSATKCNVGVAKAIIQEYSKNEYKVIGQVFKRNEGMPWPKIHIFLNWMMSGDVPEIAQEFNLVHQAKYLMLQADAIDELDDDSDDFVKDEYGNRLKNEKGEPIKNDLRIKQKIKKIDHFLTLDSITHFHHGKMKKEEEERKATVSTVETIAKAFEMIGQNAANKKVEQEKDVTNTLDSKEFIEHEP